MNQQRTVWLAAVCLVTLMIRVDNALAQSRPAPELVTEPDRIVTVSRGSRVVALKIASAILKETRQINIVLPASFSDSSPDRRYPVMVVLDGEASVPPVSAVSDELSRNGQIPEPIIVAIPNIDPIRGRLRDLTPPGLSVSGSSLNEGGDRFLDFIEQEVLPAVDRQFRGSAPRTLVGHSSGGILATYAAATRSTYRALIAIDTPIHLGDNWLATKLTERAKKAPVPLRYVSLEARFGWTEDLWKSFVAVVPSNWKVYREQFRPKESHESIVMVAMYIGLREAFGDYSMLAAPTSPTTSILPYYSKVSASLGAPVLPPRKLLLNVIEDLLIEGRGKEAREAYNSLIAGYGAPTNSARLLAEISEVERRPAPTETVEGLMTTPFPSPAEARAYLGEWVGDQWMNAAEPRTGRMTLRLSVEDGRVVGQVEDSAIPMPYRLRTIEYLRITPGGLTYGYMNGMRPRGMLLFEGKVEGDTLAGKMRFGGVEFRMPDGSIPPSLSFSFKRKGDSQRTRSVTPQAATPESDRSRKRDQWQRPNEVFDALAVKAGHRVADIGSGSGYFTFRLADRVGVTGKVFAVDIDDEAIRKVRERRDRDHVEQVEAILGAADDPKLPSGLDVVLIADTYHEFRDFEKIMGLVFSALKSGGRLGIIDGDGPAGRPRTEYHRLHTIPAELVREEIVRQGFVFKEKRPGFVDQEYNKTMYFLVFEKP